MTLVVDASVAIKWAVIEDRSSEAQSLFSRRERLIAPDLIVAEITNVVWVKQRRGEILEDQIAPSLELVLRSLDELSSMAELAPRALQIARALDHPAYDCFYLALAEARGATFVTADARLLARLKKDGWAGKFEVL